MTRYVLLCSPDRLSSCIVLPYLANRWKEMGWNPLCIMKQFEEMDPTRRFIEEELEKMDIPFQCITPFPDIEKYGSLLCALITELFHLDIKSSDYIMYAPLNLLPLEGWETYAGKPLENALIKNLNEKDKKDEKEKDVVVMMSNADLAISTFINDITPMVAYGDTSTYVLATYKMWQDAMGLYEGASIKSIIDNMVDNDWTIETHLSVKVLPRSFNVDTGDTERQISMTQPKSTFHLHREQMVDMSIPNDLTYSTRDIWERILLGYDMPTMPSYLEKLRDKKQHVHLVVFATENFYTSAILLKKNAFELSECIDHVKIFREDDIQPLCEKHPEYFTDAGKRKGYGYYSWQPYLLNKYIHSACVKDYDVVICMDAGIQIQKSLQPLVELTRKYGKLFFSIGEWKEKGYTIGRWTRRQIIHQLDELLQCNHPDIDDLPQIMGGIQIYCKTPDVLTWIDRYIDACEVDHVMNDIPSTIAQPVSEINGFQAHRHNQSVLSLCVHTSNPPCLVWPDPSQYGKKEDGGEFVNVHRSQYPPLPCVSILTPAIGHPILEKCIRSVQQQTYPQLEHIIVVDGPKWAPHIRDVLSIYKSPDDLENVYTLCKHPIYLVVLPFATGKDRWNGHRIYASLPHLSLHSDFVNFLDEDNFVSPDHIDSMMKTVQAGKLNWVYSLRDIYTEDGKYVCPDVCESLGHLHPVFNNKNDFLVDTSCYLMRRQIAMELSMVWNKPARPPHPLPEVDRHLYTLLNDRYKDFGCTGKHTLHYMVGNRSDSVRAEFFIQGNQRMYQLYGGGILPWQKSSSGQPLYVFHLTPSATASYFALPVLRRRSYAFDQWQQTMLDKLAERFDLRDGYEAIVHGYDTIPPQSFVLVNFCFYETIPTAFLKARPDLFRIAYTNEGPNIRHQAQWDITFLKEHFDRILTYWSPLLMDSKFASFCPYIQGINPDVNVDRRLLNDQSQTKKEICIVLENRSLRGHYSINDVTLTCLDMFREVYVNAFTKRKFPIQCFGKGWEKYGGKHVPNDFPSVIMRNHMFTFIIENTTADGYVSEKIYDAWAAGSIPVYYGNINPSYAIPPNIYIDAKQYKSPNALIDYLESLSDEDITAYRKAIAGQRGVLCQNACSSRLCSAVVKAIQSGGYHLSEI